MKFFEIEGFSKKTLMLVFVAKIIAGYALFLIYSNYYSDRLTADIFKYFDDSKVMYDALFAHPIDYFKMLFGIQNDNPYFDQYYHQMNNWYRVYESNLYNDSHMIIRFNAAVRIFSFGYYNVHTVFMCFISLMGLTALYKFFIQFLRDKKTLLFIAIFCIPSVVFWGSGVLKEGLLLFGLGLLIYFFNKLLTQKFSIFNLIYTLFAFVLLSYIKFYILITLVPLIVSYVWIIKTKYKFVELKFLIPLILFVLIGVNFQFFSPNYNLLEILVRKQHDFINLAQSVNSGSILIIRPLEPVWWTFVSNAPQAFLNVLIHPTIFEANSIFSILAAIENSLIIVFGLICLIFSKPSLSQKTIIYFCLLFVLLTFTLTGLITPVMGAVVRYKIPALPFLLVFFILMLDKEKFFKATKILFKDKS